MSQLIENSADVVIVGGGPIGLWTAIQIRLLSGRNVTILEKNQDYQRADIRLRIQSSSLKGIPANDLLKELTKQWGNKTVPIKKMEEALTKLAHEVGIKIIFGCKASPKTLPAEFPNATLFIGADGAKSVVRKTIFENQFRFYSNLQYMAQVQYVVEPKPEEIGNSSFQKIKDLSTTYKMQKFAEHFIVEAMHPQADGSARVTLQIFIDKETYDKISDATFKNPYYFETNLTQLPEKLRKSLIRWWGAQEELQNTIIVPDGEANKLTVVALNSYAADEVVTVKDGRLWALVGDAAAAFPFFRAINNGFLLGTKLAHCAAAGLNDDPSYLESHLKAYSRYATFRVWIERIRAFMKSLFITLAGLWLQVSNYVPWETVKLSRVQKQQIFARGNEIWTNLSNPLLQG